MKFNDFDDCRKLGEWAEALVQENFKSVFQPIFTRFAFDRFPKIQRNGIDGMIQDSKTVDIKVRRNDALVYRDILFEITSDIEDGIDGWFRTSKAQIIFYSFANKSRTKLVMAYLIDINAARQWFIDVQVEDSYPHKIAYSNRGNRVWKTENIAVPIKDIILLEIVQPFNPRIKDAEQETLSILFEARPGKPLFTTQGLLDIRSDLPSIEVQP